MHKKNVVANEDTTLDDLRKVINKKWGEDTMRFASDPDLLIERIPTGILSIDYVLGGGFARGRHTEIFGSYSVGKTYTAQKLIASAQSLGFNCAYVDVENSFDPSFAEHIGIDLGELAYHKQTHGNRVIDFMETLLRSGLLDVIVLDSIAALLPKSELESDMEGGSYGTAQAKMMSAALRRLTAANRRTVIVYINQTRDSLGSVFQKRTVTSGGRAMGFYAGTRLEMVRTENIKKKAKTVVAETGEIVTKDVVKGHRVAVRVEKDKMQPASEPVLTPNGWIDIGNLAKGDLVISSDGTPTRVKGVYPQADTTVFKVVFNDGSWTRCGPEHLWQIEERSKIKVVTTLEIKDKLASNSKANIKIPLLSGPAQTESSELPIHPYLLGALLGDGCFKKSGVGFSSADIEIINMVEENLPEGMRLIKEKGDNYDYRLVGNGNPLLHSLRKLELHNRKSKDKFVPEIYLNSDPASRILLLQGLLDTDGWVDSVSGSYGLSCSSKQLVDAARQITWLAGGTSTYRVQHFSNGFLSAHKTNLNLPAGVSPFKLTRKLELVRERIKYSPARLIKSITKEPQEESVCISVEAEDGLYVTRNGILTHNTGGALQHAQTSFVFDYETSSIDELEDIIFLGRKAGLIKKLGNNWWLVDYKEEKKNGRSRFKKWLRDHPAIQEELREEILEGGRELEEVEEEDG